ncbi:MAG: antibiotic biosynthesis monooxygenase [Gemmatimonadetes bacterium]|nr:antibiotic biosynthesis monooxygenase [Gemmatimonadota bacterium]
MIAVMLRLVAQPGKREELARRVKEEVFGPTRKEAGCIRYRFYQDVENPDAFSFVEEWESWDALNDHFRSEHVSHFLADLGDLIGEPPEAGFHEVARSRGLEAVDEARQSIPA